MTLDLDTGLFHPFHKPNENLQYVNNKSNHPKSVIKSIVKAVSHRISSLSANSSIFEQKQEYYNQALARAGYSDKIVYINNAIDTTNPNAGKSKVQVNTKTTLSAPNASVDTTLTPKKQHCLRVNIPVTDSIIDRNNKHW